MIISESIIEMNREHGRDLQREAERERLINPNFG